MLVVDDDQDAADLPCRLLRTQGYETERRLARAGKRVVIATLPVGDAVHFLGEEHADDPEQAAARAEAAEYPLVHALGRRPDLDVGSTSCVVSSSTNLRMSVTFDVFPRSVVVPTFAALLERSTEELHRFSSSVGVVARPRIQLQIRRREGDARVEHSPHDPARWSKRDYAWFTVGNVPGGTDAYYSDDAAAIASLWEGPFDDPKCYRMESLIRECAAVGHYWTFRRSAGQSAVVNLAYGLIAGCLAELTDGFVYSIDSAWDWERMPARPDDFLRFYFRPEDALDERHREWSRRCIEQLGAELGRS